MNVKFPFDLSEQIIIESLGKLTFISKARPGDKIDVKSRTFSKEGWYTSLYRTFLARRECRESTYDFVSSTFNEAIGYMNSCFESSEPSFRSLAVKLFNTIGNARTGIASLKSTYSTDEFFVAKLDGQLSLVDAKLQAVFIKYKHLIDVHVDSTANSSPDIPLIWKQSPNIPELKLDT